MRAARNADLWSGLALATLAGYIIVQASGWEYMGQDGPGPGFFPLWYGIAMAVLSVALVAASVLRGDKSDSVDWRGASRAFALWFALALSVAAFKLVGFVIGFAALCFFVVAVLYRRRAHVAAAVALALAASFYLLFPVLLGVNLP
jgi:putative tricarboxylic transport membrane protein